MSTSKYDGSRVDQASLDELFLSSPGEDLVGKLLLQLSRVPQFTKLFGKFTPDKQDQRWADYQRMDWSIRQLPCLSAFESQTEQKTSDQAWLQGAITIHVYWPPNFRRSDLARVPAAFKGILENFFSSKYVTVMLDELYYVQRDSKVYGLNEFGKEMTWTPNIEGLVESESVPVTMVDVRYRIDLRAWNRALEFMGRTKDDPFSKTLDDLTLISGSYDGTEQVDTDTEDILVTQAITVQNP